jgi:hypothetical protein
MSYTPDCLSIPGSDSSTDRNCQQCQGLGLGSCIKVAEVATTTNIAAAAAAAAAGQGVTIKPKGPQHSGTVWHSALYNSSTADAQAEFDRFVKNQDKWTPYLNSRHISPAGGPCPTNLSPKGDPGPMNDRCWHWTAVPRA